MPSYQTSFLTLSTQKPYFVKNNPHVGPTGHTGTMGPTGPAMSMSAGSNTQLIFNQNDGLTGSANLTFDSSTNILGLTGIFNAGDATVSQASSLYASVTINSGSGTITTFPANISASRTITFNVLNSLVSTTSVVLVSVTHYSGVGIPYVYISGVSNGSFTIALSNINPSITLNQPVSIGFLIC